MRLVIKVLAVAAVAIPLALAVAGSTPTTSAISEAAHAAANYTAGQRAAMRRAYETLAHPQWRTLSASARVARLANLGRRMVLAAGSSGDATPAAAAFQGNLTLVQGASGSGIALQRQADCSLSFDTGTYAFSLTALTLSVTGSSANYQDVLHAAAGLGTTPDVFAHGCAQPTAGVGSRRSFYLGRTSQNLHMFAASGYNTMAGSDALYFGTVDATTQALHSFNTDVTVPSITGLTVGDLNGDGLADIAVLNRQAGSVTVWLAHADGTLSTPTTYPTTGTTATAATTADVNGDGKLDLVVSGSTLDSATNTTTESIAVLLGNGDGTLQAARTFNVTTPSGGNPNTLTSMVAVDLRGTGRPDIVGSNGLVLLNDGNGGFRQASAFGFASPTAANTYGPNLAAGDFNEDGKPDIVVDTGGVVEIFLGKGDGSFSVGPSYASDDSVGYVAVTDLDGDGHLDLWIGLGNGGFFGGDHYSVRQGYALLGRGDGSFAGAPVLPFVYTGQNLVDLNGDGVLDGVGVNADRSFSTSLGDGHGGFTPHSTLAVSTLTFGGAAFPLDAIDSFGLADVNGDGRADLVFLGTNFMARNNAADYLTPGFIIALGDGQGGFATPTFVPAPSFVPATDLDINLSLTNVQLADVNGDGKADLVYNYDDTSYLTRQRTIGVAVQLGNGDGTFQAPRTLVLRTGADDGSFGFNTTEVQKIVDLNKDGKPDLILVAESTTLDHQVSGYESTLQVALGNGDGTFAAPVAVAGPELLPFSAGDGQPLPLAVADMNADGIPDLVVLGASTGYGAQVAIALGNGDGTFKTPSRTTFATQYLGNGQQVAVGDFNADGKPDVLLANPYGTTGIVFGAGDGTLAPLGTAGAATPNLTIVVPIGGAARVMDFNGDGKPDVLVGDVLLASMASATSTTPATFSLGVDNAAGTVKAGQPATAALTLTPDSGFTGMVAFSCSGLPTGAACAFSPASVTVNGIAATTTMTVTTTAAAMAAPMGPLDPLDPLDPRLPGGLALAGLALLAVGRLQLRSRWPARRAAWGAFALVGGVALNGCSDSDHAAGGTTAPPVTATPAGTYTVLVTATGGGVTRSVNYTLNVD